MVMYKKYKSICIYSKISYYYPNVDSNGSCINITINGLHIKRDLICMTTNT